MDRAYRRDFAPLAIGDKGLWLDQEDPAGGQGPVHLVEELLQALIAMVKMDPFREREPDDHIPYRFLRFLLFWLLWF